MKPYKVNPESPAEALKKEKDQARVLRNQNEARRLNLPSGSPLPLSPPEEFKNKKP